MLFQRSQFLFSLGAVVVFSTSLWAAPARVSVVGPDAKPLAGVKVTVSERLDYSKILPPRDLVTDQNGVVTLELDESPSPRHAYAARVVVPGLAVAGGEIRAGETQFKLQPGQKWGGVILDAAQKPVAGVGVLVSGWRPENPADFAMAIPLDGTLGFSATTDAQGRYNFDNLPLGGRASVAIADARFQSGNYNLDLTQKEAPPLFVRAGGTVAGRVVTPDGKPLGEMEIAVLNGGGFQNSKTAPDGTFLLGGLKPDARSLRSWSVKDGWVLKELPFDAVKVGETRRLPDWVATRAVELRGQLVDAATKKPLVGVEVGIQADASQSAVTDAQGRFRAFSSREVHFLRIRSETHVEKTLQEISIPPSAATYDFGPIALTPGIRLTGKVRDEAGQTPRYFYFSIQNKDRSVYQHVGSENGQIAPVALPAGAYDLVPQDTEIVSPKTLTVVAGKPLEPLQMVVKSQTETLAQIASVAGRILDEAGKPVAGVLVKFKGNANMGIGVIEAVSGFDGRFSETLLSENAPEFLGIERPGFVLGEAKTAAKVGARWQFGDISLRPGGQIFRGRVLQAGKPVAGARVALAGNNWRKPAVTDPNGNFAFEDLPRGETEFLAASANGFTHLKTRGDAPDVTLNLETAPAVDAKTLAGDLFREQPNRWEWRERWDILGADAMETLALGKNYGLAAYFSDLARRDPARLLERGPKLLPVFRAEGDNWNAEATLARVQATSKEISNQQAATQWLKREMAATRGINVQSVSQLLEMAAVATKLGRVEAPNLLEMALTFAAQLPAKTRRDNVESWGARTARVSQAALESLLGDLDAPEQFTALSAAIRAQSYSGDLANARLNLTKLEALREAPEIKAADQVERDERGRKFDSNELVTRARIALARALAPTDAAGALQIALDVDNNRNFISRLNVLLDVAQTAAKNGGLEIARSALREVSESRLMSADHGAQAGAIARGFDPQLSAQLFQKALQQAAPNEHDERHQPSVATWAFENAPLDPALSRVLLEREWSWRLPAFLAAEAAKKDPNEHNYHEGNLDNLAWAMSVLDPERALEWVKSLPEKNQRRESTKALIAITLLASPAQRVNFAQYAEYMGNVDY